MRSLNITDYPKLAQDNGLLFYHVPIRDRGCPSSSEINILIPIIVGKLLVGHNVLIHCNAGLGRAGTISACCLIHVGFDPNDAITVVRKRRPGAIQTDKQEACIREYGAKLKLLRK